MCPYKYYHVMKDSKDKKQWRYQMVHKALEIGVKPAARLFQTFPSVVRKWLKRFKTEGYRGLADRSHKPHHSPRETPKYMKEQLVALKGKYKRLGAEQVRVLENLSQAPKTMRKIWREAGIPSRKTTCAPSKNFFNSSNIRWRIPKICSTSRNITSRPRFSTCQRFSTLIGRCPAAFSSPALPITVR